MLSVKREEEDEYRLRPAQRAAVWVRGGEGGSGKDHLGAVRLNNY